MTKREQAMKCAGYFWVLMLVLSAAFSLTACSCVNSCVGCSFSLNPIERLCPVSGMAGLLAIVGLIIVIMYFMRGAAPA